MPKKGGPSNWLMCTCFDRQRSTREPPFFFQEVRIGMLVVSILFNLGRLIYEATVQDVSVILVAARVCLTILQLVDHWWFCKNWESFFIEKKMRAYIWFRLFFAVCMFCMIYCVQKTVPPYTNDSRWKVDAFQWIEGLQAMIWYLWGKRWDFKWGDMSDERRIPAIVGAMFTTSLLTGITGVYNWFGAASFSMTSGITATIAYFLAGLAFRYLNIVTIRSSQECRKILDESKVAPVTDAHNPGSLPVQVVAERRSSYAVHRPSLLPSLPSSREHDDLMINLRQSLNSHSQKQSAVSSQKQSSRPEPSLAEEDDDDDDDDDRILGNNDGENSNEKNVDEDVEKGNMDRQSIREFVHPTCSVDGTLSHIISSNKSIASTRINDNGGDNMGSASISLNVGGDGVDMDVDIDFDRLRFKPFVFTQSAKLIISLDGCSSKSSKSILPHESGSDNIESVSKAAGRVRVKPIHSTVPIVLPAISLDDGSSHVDNSGRCSNKSITLNRPNDCGDNAGSAPACSNVGGGVADVEPVQDLLIDVPLTRQNLLEANVANYETAHLLSDKIVVVIVQVKLT